MLDVSWSGVSAGESAANKGARVGSWCRFFWASAVVAIALVPWAPARALMCDGWDPLPTPFDACDREFGGKRPPAAALEDGNICDADLSGVNLAGKFLDGRKFIYVNFSNANLSRAELATIDLGLSDLTETNLVGAKLYNAKLRGTRLFRTDLRQAGFMGAIFFNAEFYGADAREADFTNADFRGVRACDSDFSKVSFFNRRVPDGRGYKVSFAGSNFSGSIFREVDLSRLHMGGFTARNVDFRGAKLDGTDFSKADLRGADFRNQVLRGTNFTQADLTGAKFTGATFDGSILEGAILTNADITGAVYQPRGGAPEIVMVKGLTSLTFSPGHESGLIKLRSALQSSGLRDLEREATYALERNTNAYRFSSPSWPRRVEAWFRMVLFDWTSRYGLQPGRALLLLLVSFLLLTPLYTWVCRRRGAPGRPGIFLIVPGERILDTDGTPRLQGESQIQRIEADGVRALKWGAYFSLASAFHIGFREFNVGNWISQLQTAPFSLDATGWVRTVAGVQSLASVLLVAMAILTYFGRPFG
jgi:uncharacterized protein YjbI with pentapeptide repeats